MRKEFIFISDGYRGGANTFLYDHMQYLIKKNKKVILIDKNPNKTFEKLNKKILIYKINLRNNISDTVKYLQKIIISKKNKKNYIMITNYAFLILFFFILEI